MEGELGSESGIKGMRKEERMSSNTRMKTLRNLRWVSSKGEEKKTWKKQPGEKEGMWKSEEEEQLRIGRCRGQIEGGEERREWKGKEEMVDSGKWSHDEGV